MARHVRISENKVPIRSFEFEEQEALFKKQARDIMQKYETSLEKQQMYFDHTEESLKAGLEALYDAFPQKPTLLSSWFQGGKRRYQKLCIQWHQEKKRLKSQLEKCHLQHRKRVDMIQKLKFSNEKALVAQYNWDKDIVRKYGTTSMQYLHQSNLKKRQQTSGLDLSLERSRNRNRSLF